VFTYFQVAMIWESDEPGQGRSITFRELSHQVNRIANFMKAMGVRKGEVVTVYMPMIPELPMVLLACTRIGAIHSVVFAGFSATSLRDRVVDCNSRWVFTADQGLRGGRPIPLKDITDKVADTHIHCKHSHTQSHLSWSIGHRRTRFCPKCLCI
jgi:acetyl-CoA synthetase